jgi:hypothetical protein
MGRPMLIIVLVIIGACASPSSPPVEYLLRPPLDEHVGAVPDPHHAALARLSVAPYLDQDGLVVETADLQIQVARQHRWAEPLSHALRHLLQSGIARASGTAVADLQSGRVDHEVAIDVDIHRLHGSLRGRVVLAAEWWLRDARTGRVIGRYEFVRSAQTSENGYDAMVRAHVTLLEQLSAAIAESLGAATPQD